MNFEFGDTAFPSKKMFWRRYYELWFGVDCYHDEDYKGQWAISGTKYRLSNENIIRDGGGTAL